MISDGGVVPCRATKGSAGYDFYAMDDIMLCAGKWTEFDSGVRLDGNERPYITAYREITPSRAYNIDDGTVCFGPIVHEADKIYLNQWVMLIVPRSSMSFKYGFRLRTGTSVIDQDFRGPITFSVTADRDITLQRNDRFAQGLIVPYGILSEERPPTKERDGGIGSTG